MPNAKPLLANSRVFVCRPRSSSSPATRLLASSLRKKSTNGSHRRLAAWAVPKSGLSTNQSHLAEGVLGRRGTFSPRGYCRQIYVPDTQKRSTQPRARRQANLLSDLTKPQFLSPLKSHKLPSLRRTALETDHFPIAL